MSWIVYPAFLSVQDQFQLSKAVSLAITDFLSLFSIEAEIKWPNDILCSGSKICGILIENSIMGDELRHSIVGIGLNVRQEVFPEFPWKATSMYLEMAGNEGAGEDKSTGATSGSDSSGEGAGKGSQEVSGEISVEATGEIAGKSAVAESGLVDDAAIGRLANLLTNSLEARYQQLAGGGASEMHTSYLQRLYRLDEPAEFTDGVTRFTGVIRGVDDTGHLLVERGSSIEGYGFHEIRMSY